MCKFQEACKNGELELAKELWSLDQTIDIEEAFCLSCSRGHLDVAMWLWSLGGINIHSQDNVAFCLSCSGGHLDVAMWLWSLDQNIDILIIEDSFHYSCLRGHLEIAKWLWNLYQNVGILNRKNSFYWSCANGHLDVAKWLWSLYPKGLIDIESINNIEFIKWLRVKGECTLEECAVYRDCFEKVLKQRNAFEKHSPLIPELTNLVKMFF